MKIRTNNKHRPLLSWHELTPKQQAIVEDFCHEGTFIAYKGWVYALEEFQRTSLPGWHGICEDSTFSGVVIRLDVASAVLGTATW